ISCANTTPSSVNVFSKAASPRWAESTSVPSQSKSSVLMVFMELHVISIDALRQCVSLECGGLTPLCYRPRSIEPKRRQAAALQIDAHWSHFLYKAADRSCNISGSLQHCHRNDSTILGVQDYEQKHLKCDSFAVRHCR